MWCIITQLAVYTTYIPLIYCLLRGYIIPTTFYGNQKQPLIRCWSQNTLRLVNPPVAESMHHPEVDSSSWYPFACGSNCANSGHVMFFCCWFWRKASKIFQAFLIIEQLVPKDKLVICIYIYIYIFCFYTTSLYFFPHLLCFFHDISGLRTESPVWHWRIHKCSGRSPRAPFVRHDFLVGGCPERDLKMVVEEWRLWTGPWMGWWDDGMMRDDDWGYGYWVCWLVSAKCYFFWLAVAG